MENIWRLSKVTGPDVWGRGVSMIETKAVNKGNGD
jgi:hypothetical protein